MVAAEDQAKAFSPTGAGQPPLAPAQRCEKASAKEPTSLISPNPAQSGRPEGRPRDLAPGHRQGGPGKIGNFLRLLKPNIFYFLCGCRIGNSWPLETKNRERTVAQHPNQLKVTQNWSKSEVTLYKMRVYAPQGSKSQKSILFWNLGGFQNWFIQKNRPNTFVWIRSTKI